MVLSSINRVCVFFDGSNFYHALKEFNLVRHLDYRKLLSKLLDNRCLVQALYYCPVIVRKWDINNVYEKQQRFFDVLRTVPSMIVVECNVSRCSTANGENKLSIKGDDIKLAVDMVTKAYKDFYDTAILVSGDADFIPAVEAVQVFGKNVENAFLSNRHSSNLERVCNRSVNLDSIVKSTFL